MYTDRWRAYLSAERRFSPLTVRAYVDDLVAFEQYLIQSEYDGDVSQATFADIRSYVMRMVERGDNPRSVNRRMAALKSYYQYLLRSCLITSNPTIKLHTLPIESRLPEFIPRKQCRELVARAQDMDEEDDPIHQRNLLIVMLLYTTGIRRAELSTLRVENVDLEQQKIRVMGKGAKEREIPLREEVCELLERYLQKYIWITEKKYLFLTKKSEPITVSGIYTAVRSVLKEVGTQGRQSPHVLRHTFATQLMSEGAPLKSIQELLGHKSLNSTQIYTHNTIESLKQSYNKAHPRAKK